MALAIFDLDETLIHGDCATAGRGCDTTMAKRCLGLWFVHFVTPLV